MSGSPQGRAPALEALLLLIVANLALQPLTEPDFGWHLRNGLDLLAHGGRVPLLDPYSHTMPEWPWVEHAWLTDVLIGWLYDGFGSFGALAVIAWFGLMTAGAWWVAGLGAQAGVAVRLCTCVLSLWIALPFLGARTQLVTVLGMAVLLWMIQQIRAGASRMVWWIPAMFLLWSNLHGGFTAGLVLLALVTGLSWTLPVLARRWPAWLERGDEPPFPVETRRHLLAATGLSVLATLINPYGWRLHQEIVESLTDRFMLETLQEWQSPSLETVAGRLFLAYLAGLMLVLAWGYRRVEPLRWTVLVVFLALACRHFRNIPLFLIVSVPLLAETLQAAVSRIGRIPAVRRVRPSYWTGGCTLVLGVMLLALGDDHVQRVWQSGTDPVRFFRRTSYPMEAVEWIRAHRDRVGVKLYNEYGHGGFLLWWLPGEKIFIDGRMPAWHLGDRHIFQDSMRVSRGDPSALSVLDRYGVDWALVGQDGPVARVLDASPAWRREYSDGKVSIYVRLHTEDRGV